MKKTSKSFQDLPPIRVRREPPTIPEAVAAAQDLADDIDQQVEIAAGLIGLPPETVREHVVAAAEAKTAEAKLAPTSHRMPERILTAASPSRAPRTVIVERRTRPPVVVERRGRPPIGRP